ncbi:MAG: acyl-CoA carboxylase subunit beta [Planctomycetes bacterium]|nr:acyl-CoA carboxylase subunit beta [Planctomycetota bacterium]
MASTPLQQKIDEIRRDEIVLRAGGGAQAIGRQHDKGRLTARERIAILTDDFFELGLWAAWQMYADWGGAPSAGVVTGIGTVAGRQVMLIANDATVKAGAFFPMTAKKVLRAQRIAMDNHLPLVYLVDSAGVFLPLQDEVFPDEDDFGRIFRNNAVISAMGIPQYAAILGNCVAGGGYLPVLCDKLLMTEGSGLYLAGPALVKAAIGQVVKHEDLGGAKMHAQISGTIDFREKDDAACLDRLKRLVAMLPADPVKVRCDAKSGKADKIAGIVTGDARQEYDVRDLLPHLLDAEPFDEYKAEFGPTLVCGYGRLGGVAVGVVANQKKRCKSPSGELQFGGVIYVDAADKAARFIMDCNQTRLPIVFLKDVNGFMVGRDSEQAGIIRSGAKLVNVIANSVVPKLTVILGGSYGAGNYALCGKAFDPRFLFAWPTARYAVMGGEQAASTLLDITISKLKRAGHTPDADELTELRRKVEASYQEQTDIRYAAARLWVDAIIEPAQTRSALLTALSVALRHDDGRAFKTGVLQT